MCLEDGYSVLYGAESIPNESAAEQLLENIKNVNSTQQVLNNISKGYLNLINADSIYESASTDYDALVDFWNSNVKQTQKNIQGLKGTMIFSAPDLYFKNDKYDTFMMFEDAIGRTFSNNTSMVCWYLEKWLNDLSLASIIRTLTSHQHIIHNKWKYKEWTKNEIIDAISRGIDKRLGDGSAILLFQSMKSRYKLDQDIIVSRPVMFEGIIKKSCRRGFCRSCGRFYS
jgi:hypothetical protein